MNLQHPGRVAARWMARFAVLLGGTAACMFAADGPAMGAAPGPGAAGTAENAPLTLERIMADPDWIGAPVRNAYWSVDGKHVYYSVKRAGSPLVDLHRIDPVTLHDEVVDDAAMAQADGPGIVDRGMKRAAFVRNGDIFLRDAGSGRLTQVTRGLGPASQLKFSADGRYLSFEIDHVWWLYDEKAGVAGPVVVKAQKDPDAAPAADAMHDLQLRTFSTLKRLRDDRDAVLRADHASRRADPTRTVAPFYLGDEVTILASSLSPDGRRMVVVTQPKPKDEEKEPEAKLTRYVTESGYEEFEKERPRVGGKSTPAQSLVMLDLVGGQMCALALDTLPGIHDDTLSAVREENGIHTGEDGKLKGRGVIVVPRDPEREFGGFRWSGDGKLAIELRALDNKDRWIVTVDFERHVLVPVHRLSDAAWVGDGYNDFGWLNDDATVWYQSEESGFAHLYTRRAGEPARALTTGRFEVSKPALSPDGRWFYVLANAVAPYSQDVYRVPSHGGTLERVTRLEGAESFTLANSGAQLLVTHSASYLPPQIAVVHSDGSRAAHELTDTRTREYRAIPWEVPTFVQVPSTHVDAMIHAKVYGMGRGGAAGASALRPGVVFVHGAGYLQNVHKRYPYYFHEQMFHNFLVQRGYVVIDMDYRASQGYGRDWRTAIYRQMGHPELEDLLDGKQWLVAHAGVDKNRVVMYGGSYGGFMTLMALFRAPGEFVAGAALRPVTDWMQYDPEYTSDILNTPQIDPIAYARSSPIEFASGLQDRLLICHGVIDDNVLFADSMRLYQRLVELHKDHFALSPYALDRHGFVNADSWLDEYKRIYALFDEAVRR